MGFKNLKYSFDKDKMAAEREQQRRKRKERREEEEGKKKKKKRKEVVVEKGVISNKLGKLIWEFILNRM